MDSTLGWKKTVLYSLLPTLVLLAGLETVGRVIEIWLPPLNMDYGWGFVPNGEMYVPSQDNADLMVTNPAKTSFHYQTFLKNKPENGIRIFMVGESSVHELLDRMKELNQRLNERYGGRYTFECINAGALAFGSHRLTPVVASILDYDPDLVLVYMGHNEFAEGDQAKLIRPERLPLQQLLYRSAFCRFLRDRLAWFQLSEYQRVKNKEILSSPVVNWMAYANTTYTAGQIQEKMQDFRNNYRLMIELCQKRGVPVIMGTVPSNLWFPDFLDKGDQAPKLQQMYAAGRYEEGKKFAQGILTTSKRLQSSDVENQIIRDISQEFNVPLADVETAVTNAEPHRVPGETMFRDRCHLNEQHGQDVLVRTFEEQIVNQLHNRGVNP